MNPTTTLNYPDIMGAMTANRLTIGVVQAALAVRPTIIAAGRPFEVLVLLQNLSDSQVDVRVVLSLPDVDAKKRKDHFIAKTTRLVIGMEAAEVGYVSLPITTLPDTAPSRDYKLMMEITPKPLTKPGRVRLGDGGSEAHLDKLSEETQDAIAQLRKLNFTAVKKGLRGTTLEATFGLLAGRAGSLADLKPGWTRLWTTADHKEDETALLAKHAATIRDELLPKLTRARLLPPLMDEVSKRFTKAGYPLSEMEAGMVARLMMLVLEHAPVSPESRHTQPFTAKPEYEIAPLVMVDAVVDYETVRLPHWLTAVLATIERDTRAARYPERAIPAFAFDALLRDAVRLGFRTIEELTEEELGTEAEIETYSENFFAAFQAEEPLDFTTVYLPLVMGGVAIHDTMMLSSEDHRAVLSAVMVALRERKDERSPDNQAVFTMAREVFDIMLMKYGFRSETE